MVLPGSPEIRFFHPFSMFFSASSWGSPENEIFSSSAVVELDRDLEGVDLVPATIGAPRDAPSRLGPPEDNPDWKWLLWYGG